MSEFHAEAPQANASEGLAQGPHMAASAGSCASDVPPKLCARTQVKRRAHARKFGAHIKFPPKNVLAHSSYTSFKIQISSGKMLNVAQKKFYAHTDFAKLE